jgi:serine/threonine-protein phosphatase 2A regulatory subunit B''
MVARTRFLHHKTSEILDKEDLEKLWNLLKDHISPPNDMKERINYKYLFNEVIIKKLPTNCPKNAVTFSQPLLF